MLSDASGGPKPTSCSLDLSPLSPTSALTPAASKGPSSSPALAPSARSSRGMAVAKLLATSGTAGATSAEAISLRPCAEGNGRKPGRRRCLRLTPMTTDASFVLERLALSSTGSAALAPSLLKAGLPLLPSPVWLGTPCLTIGPDTSSYMACWRLRLLSPLGNLTALSRGSSPSLTTLLASATSRGTATALLLMGSGLP